MSHVTNNSKSNPLNWQLIQLSNKVMEKVFAKTPKGYWDSEA